MRDKRYPVVGDPCVCGEGHLEFVKGGNRWDVDHLMCSKCDGTYALIEQPFLVVWDTQLFPVVKWEQISNGCNQPKGSLRVTSTREADPNEILFGIYPVISLLFA